MRALKKILILWLILGVATACGRQIVSARPSYFFDLIVGSKTDDEKTTSKDYWVLPEGGPGEPILTHCLDGTRQGFELKPGTRLIADLDDASGGSSQPTELSLEACSASHQTPTSIRIRWTSGKDGETVFAEQIELPALKSIRTAFRLPVGGNHLEIYVPESSGASVYLQEAAVDGAAPSRNPQSSRSTEGEAAEQPRQILFISVDTLREDGIAALGGSSATPNLDALVAESQVWSPHYAGATWTQPSHATLLTGQPSPLHGVQNPRDAIHAGVTTVAERMRGAGLLTAARVYDCVWLDPKFGFDRGFEDYETRPFGLAKMAREVANWMTDHRDRSFFFFFHNFEPHSDFSYLPYEAPGVTKAEVEASSGLENFGCRGDICSSALLQQMELGKIEPLDGELEVLESLYREGVSYTDQQLGVLFERLKSLGMWDRLMIVVTSDHGESFETSGRVMHGGTWEEVLRVPLIIKWPRGEFAGERRDVPTSSIDLAPTLTAFVESDSQGLPGTDLRVKRRATPIFAGTIERIVVAEGWKGVFRPKWPTKLYHLDEDPGERNNLAEANPEDRERLLNLLRRWFESLKPQIEARDRRAEAGPANQDLTQEEIQRLKSLGYLANE